MGYRSDVALVLRNEEWERFEGLVKSEPDDENRAELLDYIKAAEITQGEKYTVAVWDYVKWYANAMVEFVERFTSNTPHIIHRLGEDNNDYEYKESVGDDWEMHDCVSLVRHLEININPLKAE